MPSNLTQGRRERLTGRLALAEPQRPMVEGTFAPLVVVDASDLRALLADSEALEAAERERDEARKDAEGWRNGKEQVQALFDGLWETCGKYAKERADTHLWMSLAFGEPTQDAFLRVFDSWRADNAALREQVARLREALSEASDYIAGGIIYGEPEEGQDPLDMLKDRLQAALRSTAPEGEEGGTR